MTAKAPTALPVLMVFFICVAIAIAAPREQPKAPAPRQKVVTEKIKLSDASKVAIDAQRKVTVKMEKALAELRDAKKPHEEENFDAAR